MPFEKLHFDQVINQSHNSYENKDLKTHVIILNNLLEDSARENKNTEQLPTSIKFPQSTRYLETFYVHI